MPDENVLGPVGQGYKIAIDTLNEGRIGIGAQMIGVAQGALDADDRVREGAQAVRQAARRLPGRSSSSSRRPRTELEAARLMVYNAARLKDAGNDIAREGAMAKLFSSQVCERVTSLCVELFGGYGYTKDYPGREVLSRREDRHDLRGHVEHAAADDRQGDAQIVRPHMLAN